LGMPLVERRPSGLTIVEADPQQLPLPLPLHAAFGPDNIAASAPTEKGEE
jgi:hypothetical protein